MSGTFRALPKLTQAIFKTKWKSFRDNLARIGLDVGFYFDILVYISTIFVILENLRKNIKSDRSLVVEIFEKHYDRLLLFGLHFGAKKALVEDSIQDLFLKFCENEQLLIGADYPEAYLKSSLRRHLLKKMKDKTFSVDGTSKVFEISVPSYEDQLIKQQNSLQASLNVKDALSMLTKSQKTIMTMRFYRSMSYEDIASKLGITKRTVYNQVHDAMKKMRGCLEQEAS